MTLYFEYTNLITANGNALTLSDGDGLFIASGVTVAGGTGNSEGVGVGAYSAGGGLSVQILGTLWGEGLGLEADGSDGHSNVFVGSGGYVIGAEYSAIALGGTSNIITNDGQIIGGYAGIFIGSGSNLSAATGNSEITNNGQIEAGSGIILSGGGNLITNTGTIIGTGGNGNAIYFESEPDLVNTVHNTGTIEGVATSPNNIASAITDADVVGELLVTNSGTIEANITWAIVAAGSLYLKDSGSIAGAKGIIAYAPDGYSNISVLAGGSITGTSESAVELGGYGNFITNHGEISTLAQDSAIDLSTLSTGSNFITNTGLISGWGGISAAGGSNTIENSGRIDGGIGFGTPTGTVDTIDNSGVIASIGSSVGIGDSGIGAVAITNSGHINGSIACIGSNGSNDILIEKSGIDSAGKYLGLEVSAIVLTGMNNVITNDGEISCLSGATALAIFATTLSHDAGGNTITNEGLIVGGVGISLAGGGNSISNNGVVDGATQGIVLATATGATDAIDNTGTIKISATGTDAIVDTGAGALKLVNAGVVRGDIKFGGTGDTLNNDGAIHGSVTMGGGDTVLNNGSIYGSITLGSGDTFDTGAGSVTGKVIAGTGDTFDFSGSFGKYTIADFAATGTHDVISFASDDFTSYTELQSHMAQEGNDVVITLDSGDDIILLGRKLASLVAHDFAFT